MQRKHHAASGQGGENGSIFAARLSRSLFNALARKRYGGLTSALTVASFLAMAGSGALADEAAGQGRSAAQLTNEQLIEKLERMEARIRSLESELHRKGEANAKHGSKARVANTPQQGRERHGRSLNSGWSARVPTIGAIEPPPPGKRAPGGGLALGTGAWLSWRQGNSRARSATASRHGSVRRRPLAYPRSRHRRLWRIRLRGACKTPLRLVNGKPASIPRGSFSPQPISSTTISFSTPRSNGSTAALQPMPTTSCTGEINIEQAWVDFRITPYFNIRAPGIDLVPIDWLNLYHEPTRYYSVLRPELNRGLIPSTWRAPAASIWGQIVEGLNYQFQVNSALEDFGGGPITDARTSAALPDRL